MRVRLMALLLGLVVLGMAAPALAQQRDAAAPPVATADASAMAAGGDASAAVTPPPAVTADASTNLTGEQYVVRLRDLEQRINELKEEIFRSKARLSLLAEAILQNVVGGARAIVQHENEMGPSFRLVRAVYALDGAPLLTRTDTNGSLADMHDFPVYNGQIGAGEHTLTVNLEYQGNGYGIFSYVKGYTFRVRSTQSFSVPDGKAIQIRVVGYEKGGPTTPPEERPAVRYIQRIITLREAAESEQDNSTNGTNTNSGGAAGGGNSGGQGATPAPAPGNTGTSP